MSHVKHAIILAGGKGERLRPLTDGRPKSMVEVAGVPILDYQLKALREGGVEEVVLTVSYLKEVIQDHVGDGDKARYQGHIFRGRDAAGPGRSDQAGDEADRD